MISTRRVRAIAAGLAIAVALAACADAWAGGIARNIAAGLASIRSYRAVSVETGIAGVPIERSILYAKPWRVRVETTTPGPHAGELFIYDGDAITMWYPQLLFGVRIRGAHAPTELEALHHLERLTKTNLDAYTFELEDERAHVAGQRALEWFVRPARRAPFRMAHRVWNHDPSTLPLKMELFNEDRSRWYAFELERLAFDVPVPADAFAFAFPRNAVVFEWDLDAPGITLEEARATMNFKVAVPSQLPRGHAIRKIIRSPHCLPMLLIDMDFDGTTLSLTESRETGEAIHPLGIEIMLGKTPATLSFLGAFAVVSWVEAGTRLTLTSNLDFASLIGVATSVE